ncbi:hypothetical protein ACPB8Q_01875 [Methanocaldococcus indicus]|uniref:hypothetical protein n=1 Tax=Methanocaldococcus indicus TaxID=213231 RepID=UPI003C6D4F4C
MKIWITTVGTSPYAVFNTLWFAIVRDSYLPDKIYFLWNDKVKHNLEKLEKWVNILSNEYNFKVEINKDYKVSEENIKEFSNALKKIIKNEKLKNNEIAIDITPGRKFMSAFSLFAGLEGVEGKYKCDKVYYLHLKDLKYMNYPLFLIPFSIQELYEFNSWLKNEKIDKNPLKIDGKDNKKVNRENLMAILNNMYLFDKHTTKIKVNGQEFAKITLLNDNKAKVEVNKNIKLDDELYGNFINNILNSINEVKYTYDFETWLNEEEFFNSLLNKFKEKETYYITFDTNALINQIPRKLIDFLENNKEKILPNFVLSESVSNELSTEFYKIKNPKDKDFENQPSPKDRVFKLGLSQVEYLKNKNCIIIPYKGKGDNEIKESFLEFLKDKNGKLLVITSDKEFFSNLDALTNIIPIYVSFDKPKDFLTWENVRDFIYTTAVVFGKINLKYVGEILSVWRGKNPNEWKKELLLIRNLDKNSIKAINILENIQKEGR